MSNLVFEELGKFSSKSTRKGRNICLSARAEHLLPKYSSWTWYVRLMPSHRHMIELRDHFQATRTDSDRLTGLAIGQSFHEMRWVDQWHETTSAEQEHLLISMPESYQRVQVLAITGCQHINSFGFGYVSFGIQPDARALGLVIRQSSSYPPACTSTYPTLAETYPQLNRGHVKQTKYISKIRFWYSQRAVRHCGPSPITTW